MMNVFLSTFGAVFTLFFIGFVGWWVVSRRMLTESVFSVLSSLSLEIALPAMIFSDIIRKFDTVSYPNWYLLPIWWVGFTLFTLLLTMLFSLFSIKKYASEFRLSLFYHNGIFFPLAIFSTIPAYSHMVIDVFFFTMFYAALLFNTYFLFFSKSERKISVQKMFHPVLISVVAAIIIVVSGLKEYFPSSVTNALIMIGSMSVPLLMMILGGNVFTDLKSIGKFQKTEVFKFVFVKNILFPLIMLIVVYFIKPPENIALLLVVEASVPPITAAPILIERAGGNRGLGSVYLLFSFVFSLVTIPLFITLFNMIMR